MLLAAAAVLIGSPAIAGGLTSIQSVQTQLGLDALSVKNERSASFVSASGENIDVTSLPSLGAGTAGTAVATTAAVTNGVLNPGAPFQFSESAFAGSSAAALTPTVSNASGTLSALGAGDVVTITNGGIAGTLAATNLGNGTATITAGGSGSQATLTRSNTLSVFQ